MTKTCHETEAQRMRRLAEKGAKVRKAKREAAKEKPNVQPKRRS